MAVEKITDYASRALGRLPDHLLDATDFRKLVTAISEEAQEVEDFYDDLFNLRMIDAAEGEQLDQIATILDVERSVGQSDTAFRAAIYGKAAALQQAGEPETLIQVYKLIWTATKVFLIEHPPATIELIAEVTTDPESSGLDTQAIRAIDGVKAAGVEAAVGLAVTPVFLWGDEPNANAAGDLPASSIGVGDEADANANGNLDPGEGGGNFARILT